MAPESDTPLMYAEKTRVPSHQTRMQIEQLLGKHKAAQYGTFVDNAGGTVLRTQHSLIDGRVVELVDGTHFATCPDAKAWRKKARST